MHLSERSLIMDTDTEKKPTVKELKMTHLDALELRLSNERVYLSAAKTENERNLRRVWITQIEKEIESEKKFLLLTEEELNLTDEELLNDLLRETVENYIETKLK